jgi:hypothetical protein
MDQKWYTDLIILSTSYIHYCINCNYTLYTCSTFNDWALKNFELVVQYNAYCNDVKLIRKSHNADLLSNFWTDGAECNLL